MAGQSVKQLFITCPGHTRPVVHLDFSGLIDDGYFLISASKDGYPMLRKGETGDWLGTFQGHKGAAVWAATLNRDATKAATGAADFSAKVWNAENGDELASFPHRHIVKSVAFSSSGDKLLTASNEKLVRVFDITSPDEPLVSFKGHTDNLKKVVWFGDDKLIMSISDDKTLRVWDVVSGSEVKNTSLPQRPGDIEINKDMTSFILACGENVSFWDLKETEKIKEFALPCTIHSASLHPDGDCFVCGGQDFKMYKFCSETGRELESYKGHFGPIHCIRFSPDGRVYASGSEDGTLRLWQTTVGETFGLWKYVLPSENS